MFNESDNPREIYFPPGLSKEEQSDLKDLGDTLVRILSTFNLSKRVEIATEKNNDRRTEMIEDVLKGVDMGGWYVDDGHFVDPGANNTWVYFNADGSYHFTCPQADPLSENFVRFYKDHFERSLK